MKLIKTQHRLFVVLFVVCFLIVSLVMAQAESVGVRPADFDGRGAILRMGKTEIVIDDMLFHYEAGTAFYSKSNRKIGSGSFSEGMQVGFVLKKRGYQALQEVWRIK